MMFVPLRVVCVGICLAVLAAAPALAGQPKLDKETCTQLHTEQATFIQSGILADLQRGPAWGKNNLSADRLREVEHYILLDEQIKFACREATLTPEMERAAEVAKKLELNSDADPFAPPPPKPDNVPKASDGAQPVPSAVPDDPAKPGLTPKAERRAAPPVGVAAPAAAKTASDAQPVAKPKPSVKADDALKAPPTYVAPAPAAPAAKPASGLSP